MLFRIAVVLLAGLGQALLGEAEGLSALPGGEHGLNGSAAVAKLGRGALDQPVEELLGGVGFAPASVNLSATQFVVVATVSVVVLEVMLLALVEVVQGRLGVAFAQGELNQVHETGVSIRPLGTRRSVDDR